MSPQRHRRGAGSRGPAGTARRAPGPPGRAARRRFDARPAPATSRTAPRGPGYPFARRSTRRLAILAGIFVLLAIMLVPTLRGYVQQRRTYRQLEMQVAQQERTRDELQRQVTEWENPAYVEEQARARLKYVRPGETAYVVVGADAVREQAQHGRAVAFRPESGASSAPWYALVWGSVVDGDEDNGDRSESRVTTLGDASAAPRP